MKAVLAAFRAPMADGSEVRTLGLSEFREFWTALEKHEQDAYKSNAFDMGFTEA